MEHETLRVMNTRTHAIETFTPVEPGHVRMYVCGPSVYDETHLGHARSYVAYDAIKRYLRVKGYRVTHVQNFTDVEENIATRANQAGLAPIDYATRLIEHFLRDMDALHVARADHYPRVTENIDGIIEMIKKLEKKGVAYRFDCGPRKHTDSAACDVYFDVTNVKDYGELIGTSIEELTVERPVEMGDRRNPLDFALWKSRDDWGVTWDSPWGRGRPGWHIECTVMASKHLGTQFDIHGGGLDLVFPHHENERVIGEAVSDHRYCNAYLHNGFVTVGNEKMSKSLGNFVSVSQLLERHDPEVLRVFLLSRHYRAALNYDDRSIQAATERLARWNAALDTLTAAAAGHTAPPTPAALVEPHRKAFFAALDDDFHFGRALDAVDATFDASKNAKGPEAASALAFLREAARALGILWKLEA